MTETVKNRIVKTWWDKCLGLDGMTVDDRKELRRNLVRIWVTYGAAFYLFILGPIFCVILFTRTPTSSLDAAKDLFLAILPIASGIVAYWFATRSQKSNG